MQVLDVREKYERDEGYIPGTRHIPYRLVRGSCTRRLDTRPPVVTICETGTRAGIAASVLAAAGVDARPVLNGGIDDWPRRGHPLTLQPLRLYLIRSHAGSRGPAIAASTAAVLLVPRHQRQLDLGLGRPACPCPRGGARPR